MNLLRHAYNNNPFYIISALLVLFGLRSIFPSGESTAYDWVLMASLIAYISLLAVTARLIVRIGNVWEDTRSILLIIVVLMLALSVSFDEKIIAHPIPGGVLLLLGGLGFSLAISMALLRGLRINLPRLFRWSYYLLLGEFFLCPLGLSFLLRTGKQSASEWGILGFSLVFGLSLLCLLPAVRRGSTYVRDSGTPWRWPWFPWTLFALMSICAFGRSYSFSLSFGTDHGLDTAFAPYFLAPILMGIFFIVLEAGIVARHAGTQRLALTAPFALPLLILLSPGSSPAQQKFLGVFLETLPSPAFLTLAAMALLYGYGWIRRVAGAEGALMLTLVSFAVVSSNRVDLTTRMDVRAAPILLVAAIQLLLAIRRPASWRFFTAAAAWVATASVALAEKGFLDSGGILPIHLMVGVSLLLGWRFTDPFARLLRGMSPVLLTLLYFLALNFHVQIVPGAPGWALAAYLVALPLIQFGYWHVAGAVVSLYAGMASIILSCLRLGYDALGLIRKVPWSRGLTMVTVGIVFFLVAAGISLSKAGVFDSLKEWAGRRLRPQGRGKPPDGGGDSVLEDPGM